MLSVFGISVFLFLFFGMLWRNACRWRYLADRYGSPNDRVVEESGLQSAVLLGLGGFNALKGILKIGVNDKGVRFRVLKPFALFHTPLFIPHEEISGWKTTWYLDTPSTEFEFRRAPDVKMVVPTEQAQWIQRKSGQKMMLRDASPPRGKAGQGWRAFVLGTAFINIAMLIATGVYLLVRHMAG